GRDATCSCEAAVAGRYCWHKAAVVLARQRHEWQVAAKRAAGTPAPTAILEPASSAQSLRRVALV
ncbi:MAG TPA: SWIM zinc finger family protein, partial [Chloroflexota bacterium]|nr:SWIM zinc finger family protein [Chloroflexota bacterium]